MKRKRKNQCVIKLVPGLCLLMSHHPACEISRCRIHTMSVWCTELSSTHVDMNDYV